MSRRPKNEDKRFHQQVCGVQIITSGFSRHRHADHGDVSCLQRISRHTVFVSTGFDASVTASASNPLGSNSPVAWAYRDLGTSDHGSSALPICAYVVDLRCGTWDNTQHVFLTHSSMKNYEAMWQVHLCDSHGRCVLELCHLSISLHRTKERRDILPDKQDRFIYHIRRRSENIGFLLGMIHCSPPVRLGLFPTCQVRVARFYVSSTPRRPPPPSPPLLRPRRTTTASSWSQCSPPDPNSKLPKGSAIENNQ